MAGEGTTTNWARVRELYERASDLDGEARRRFLESECPGDAELRREVAELLEETDGLDDYLEPPDRSGIVQRSLGPYRLVERIGSGGMGVVYRAARNGDFEREVAIKLLRPELDDLENRRRLLAERQLLATLEHEGIARLYDGGTTPDGRTYLVLEFVRGRPVDAHCDAERADVPTRLRLFVRICAAVSFAHRHLVVHGDLKPSNVLVTADGECKLLDFGIARVIDEAGATSATTLNLRLTPRYASPEQRSGGSLTTASDVFSLGVLLFELLTGRRLAAPNSPAHTGSAAVLRSTREVEPSRGPGEVSIEQLASLRRTSASELSRTLVGDLDSVLAHALERKPENRYSSVEGLAEDIERYLAGLPLRVRGTAVLYRGRKLLRRHRVAVACAALTVFALVFATAFSTSAWRGTERALDSVQRLSHLQRFEELQRSAREELWPANERVEPRMRDWVAEARILVGRLTKHEARLAELRANEARRSASPAWTEEAAWEMNRLVELIARLEWMDDEASMEVGTISEMERRAEFSASVTRRSIHVAAPDWERAIAAIRDPGRCPAYGGLVLEPQAGLVPLGPDPSSSLWEFAHLQTGEPAKRDDDGLLVTNEATGVVLVLVPGGAARVGAQSTDESAPHYDPGAGLMEVPPHTAALKPYFLSKFEMTQAQWLRATGLNPSQHAAGSGRIDGRHPVESVSWDDAAHVLGALGLTLPTEVQWEYAARAGTGTIWPTGDAAESLVDFANLLDRNGVRYRSDVERIETNGEDWLDDGEPLHGPVGSYRPNAWGLHDIIGNVREWCVDWYTRYDRETRVGDGLRIGTVERSRIHRGGNFLSRVTSARSSQRMHARPQDTSRGIGVRPARYLDS